MIIWWVGNDLTQNNSSTDWFNCKWTKNSKEALCYIESRQPSMGRLSIAVRMHLGTALEEDQGGRRVRWSGSPMHVPWMKIWSIRGIQSSSKTIKYQMICRKILSKKDRRREKDRECCRSLNPHTGILPSSKKTISHSFPKIIQMRSLVERWTNPPSIT